MLSYDSRYVFTYNNTIYNYIKLNKNIKKEKVFFMPLPIMK